jgi:hypothetical protein
MTTNKPLTTEQFIDLFEKAVQSYENEFFFRGARELIANLKGWGLEKNQDSVINFLNQCLILNRNQSSNSPDINDVRNQIRSILGLDSGDLRQTLQKEESCREIISESIRSRLKKSIDNER